MIQWLRNTLVDGALLRKQDWVLTGAVLTLMSIGTMLIWSATRPRMIVLGLDPNSYLKKQIITVAVALVLGLAVVQMKYLMLRALAPFIYGFGLLGLIAVLIPHVGTEVNGIQAWIPLPGGFTLQPSEFVKLAVVLTLSMVLSETVQRYAVPGLRDFIMSLALVAVPAGLIMLQPDFGTTLVIGVVMLGLFSASGVPIKYLSALAVTGVGVLVLAWTNPRILHEYQKDRLTVFIDPAADAQGAGYTLQQVRMAIGSGGWTGQGLFNGPQTNGRFIPEQQTDFVFSVAGEELGFLGASAIVILLFVICWRALAIARRSSDKFGRIAASGIGIWIAFQAFQNIGMNLGMMPVTGVPLPFVSYGGSSLFSLCMAVGLLQNIRMKVTD